MFLRKKAQSYLILMCLLSLAIGCQTAVAGSSPSSPNTTTQSTSAVAVTKTVSDEPMPSPTPFSCTALPAGMTLELNPVSPVFVELVVQGLQSNEEITVVFTAESPGHRKMIENPGILIGADGQYATQELLRPIPESDENHWQVSVIHARGVACAEVTLPSETD